jgi:hypothetical protein
MAISRRNVVTGAAAALTSIALPVRKAAVCNAIELVFTAVYTDGIRTAKLVSECSVYINYTDVPYGFIGRSIFLKRGDSHAGGAMADGTVGRSPSNM